MRAKLIKGGAFSPPNTWNVLLDGYRWLIQDESYGVAAAVEHAINHPEQWEPTEAYEIAAAVGERWPLPVSGGTGGLMREQGESSLASSARAYMVKQFLGHVARAATPDQRFRVFTTGDDKYYLLDPLIPGTDCSGCIQFPILRRVLNQRVRSGALRRVL